MSGKSSKNDNRTSIDLVSHEESTSYFYNQTNKETNNIPVISRNVINGPINIINGNENSKTELNINNTDEKNNKWHLKHPWIFAIVTGSIAAFLGGLALLLPNIIDNKSENTITYQENTNSEIPINTSQTVISGEVSKSISTEDTESTDIDGLNPGPDILYPIDAFVINKQKVGEWYYFIYKTDLTEKFLMPVLYRSKDMDVAERVSPRSCDKFIVNNNSIYYVDFPYIGDWHGELYVCRPDGKNERLIKDEIHYFDIVNDYIYFTYSFDTTGPGIEAHAMHRINLDGSNPIIVAYEYDLPKYGYCHFNYRVIDEWVYCYSKDWKNGEWIDKIPQFRIKMVENATGLEPIEFLIDIDEEWVYYITNRLIKAKTDGSELIVLDDIEDVNYFITKIDDDWIYYRKLNDMYKIKKDGSSKTLIKE